MAEKEEPMVAPEGAVAAASDPDPTRIAVLAYQLWLEKGCPTGSDQEDWFRAESLLKGETAAE